MILTHHYFGVGGFGDFFLWLLMWYILYVVSLSQNGWGTVRKATFRQGYSEDSFSHKREGIANTKSVGLFQWFKIKL